LLHKEDANQADYAIIHNTLKKRSNKLWKRLLSIFTDCVTLNRLMKKRRIIDKLFFSLTKRYNLGRVVIE
jgi:DNA-directed RNA polymerase subunit beta